jgi:hypothetical protein
MAFKTLERSDLIRMLPYYIKDQIKIDQVKELI